MFDHQKFMARYGEHGLPHDPNCYCFIDAETRSEPGTPHPDNDLTTCGAHRYARSAFPVIWTWCIGNDKVRIMALDDGFDKYITWKHDAPKKLRKFHKRVRAGKAWYVAWNMPFDFQIWKHSSFPPLSVENTLDAMVQAGSSNLPSKLDMAAKSLKLGGKAEQGKLLINLFAPHDGATPQSHPKEWAEYKKYGKRDTDLLRQIFLGTRRLPAVEWLDYWTSEHINAKGFAVDTYFCEQAAAVAVESAAETDSLLLKATQGAIPKITLAGQIGQWLYDNIAEHEGRDILVTSYSDDERQLPDKISVSKDRLEGLLAYYADRELGELDVRILEVVGLRLHGGSATPKKFQTILNTQTDGRVRGQYVFNGAQQTGRYSSRGVQVHNLVRSAPPQENEILCLLAGEEDNG